MSSVKSAFDVVIRPCQLSTGRCAYKEGKKEAGKSILVAVPVLNGTCVNLDEEVVSIDNIPRSGWHSPVVAGAELYLRHPTETWHVQLSKAVLVQALASKLDLTNLSFVMNRVGTSLELCFNSDRVVFETPLSHADHGRMVKSRKRSKTVWYIEKILDVSQTVMLWSPTERFKHMSISEFEEKFTIVRNQPAAEVFSKKGKAARYVHSTVGIYLDLRDDGSFVVTEVDSLNGSRPIADEQMSPESLSVLRAFEADLTKVMALAQEPRPQTGLSQIQMEVSTLKRLIETSQAISTYWLYGKPAINSDFVIRKQLELEVITVEGAREFLAIASTLKKNVHVITLQLGVTETVLESTSVEELSTLFWDWLQKNVVEMVVVFSLSEPIPIDSAERDLGLHHRPFVALSIV